MQNYTKEATAAENPTKKSKSLEQKRLKENFIENSVKLKTKKAHKFLLKNSEKLGKLSKLDECLRKSLNSEFQKLKYFSKKSK